MVVKQDTRAKNIFKNRKNSKGILKKKLKPKFISDVKSPENGETVNNPKVHLVSQEIKFAKTLAGNDPALRQKNLNKFKKWLKIRSDSSYPFTDADFLRLWQGLFYCMWMSDKPLVQEALAEDIASLVHCFTKSTVAVQFYGTFLKTMCDGWFGIDQWRIDKFMMLVRRMTRQMFKLLKTQEWNTDLVKEFRSKIGGTILVVGQHNYAGLTMHYTELYLEELAKISGGDVPPVTVNFLIKPFAQFIENADDRRLLEHIKENIFYQLIKQSDLGRDYQERYEIWKEAGCPTRSVDDCIITEKIVPASDDEEAEGNEDDDEELNAIDKEINDIENKPLDPRAGLVDVDIPEIMFKPEQIIKGFQKVMYQPTTRTKNRVLMKTIIGKMEQYMEDQYPFTERGFPDLEEAYRQLPDIDKAAKNWQKFEDSLYKDTRKFKKITKHLKHMGKAKRAKAEKVLKKLGGMLSKTNNKENETTDDIVEEEIIERHERKPYRNLWMEEDIIEEHSERSAEDSFIKRRPKNKKETSKKQNKTMQLPSNEEEKEIPLKLGLKRRSISTESPKTPKPAKQPVFKTDDAWSQPLQDGEVEIFLPSRKAKLAAINKPVTNTEETEIVITPKKKFVLNPFAASKSATPAKQKLRGKAATAAASRLSLNLNSTPSSEKHVKIALENNRHQDAHEYLKQVKRSPQIPHDSSKRPMKGLLKPNAMPSPINPFYKK